jgi:hypothetical protein
MRDAAKVVDEAKERASGAAHRTRSAVVDALHTLAGAATTLRRLGLSDALGSLGLRRRGVPKSSIVAFGAGFLSGAAAGVLLAPFSGAETRRLISERVARALRRDAPERPKPPDGVRRASENGGSTQVARKSVESDVLGSRE